MTTSGLRPPLPRELQVEVTGACNLRCHMCLVRYRPPLNRISGSMTFDRFRAIVDQLPDLDTLTLQGLGEPLLAPDLMAMVAYAVERGIEVGFNTNGTLLTRAWSERLVDAGLAWLHVSLDGATASTYEAIRDGGNFERVCTNLRGLLEVKRARGRPAPRVQLNMVLMRSNAIEVPDLVTLAAELGVDRVWVQNLSHDFSDTDPAGTYVEIRGFAEREALWDGDADDVLAEARRRAAELGIDLRLPDSGATPAPRAPGSPGCDWPWRSAYVTHDAKVQPCCMVMGADRAVVGDLESESFADAWHGPEYQRFRAGLLGPTPNDVCRGCSMYRAKF